MNKIDTAIARLDGAMTRLEQAMAEDAGAVAEADMAVKAERDRLEDEVRVLRARAEEDAKLRAEAASAVREALRDLRGAVARQSGEGKRANA